MRQVDLSEVRREPVARGLGFRRAVVAVAVTAALLTSSAVGASSATAAPLAAASGAGSCTVVPFTKAVPAKGVLLGVNLDFGSGTLAQYAKSIGRKPAVATTFVSFPLTRSDKANLAGAVTQVKANGGVLLVTLEPKHGLAKVTPKVVASFARRAAAINARGVPVMVRFAQEMNGSWYPWGERPAAYKRAFQQLAAAVHKRAKGSAMIWAPNYGGGYPFVGGEYGARPGTADFRALDTNHDGALTMQDDPYLPYYPGDRAVDWVGMSLYHWGSTYPWGKNQVPEAGKFAEQLTGTYDGAAGDDRAVPDFYAVFAKAHGKPLAITETAALYVHHQSGPTELQVKRAWWRQVFSPATLHRFPRIRMINWFNWNKQEAEVHKKVDWTTTSSKRLRHAFEADLSPALRTAASVRSVCR
jgi:hypothetical protein